MQENTMIYFLLTIKMHTIKREQLEQQIQKPMIISIRKYPHNIQKMSRWEQCTDNYQDLHESAFLWEEIEKNNRVSHKPEIGRIPKMSKGTSVGTTVRPRSV